MPGGVDVDPVAVAGVDHLGVAGGHLDAGGARGRAERLGDPAPTTASSTPSSRMKPQER